MYDTWTRFRNEYKTEILVLVNVANVQLNNMILMRERERERETKLLILIHFL